MTRSLGLLYRRPSKRSVSTSTSPLSISVRTSRRRPPGPDSLPSQLTRRPCRSNMFPLVRPLSSRKTERTPSAESFMMRLLAISLKKTLPSASAAGPSVNAMMAAEVNLELAATQSESWGRREGLSDMKPPESWPAPTRCRAEPADTLIQQGTGAKGHNYGTPPRQWQTKLLPGRPWKTSIDRSSEPLDRSGTAPRREWWSRRRRTPGP